MQTRTHSCRAFVTIALLLVSAAAFAQDLATERKAVLRSHGSVEHADLDLFPVQPSPGLVFEQPVAYPDAESLRLHFVRLDEEAADGSWEIRVLQDNETRSTITHVELAGKSYWSDEFAGSMVVVQIHSTESDSPLRVRIEDVAVGKRAPVRLSITGDNQLTPIDLQDAWVRESGTSIARLRFTADDREIYTCTAFLLAPRLMLTNQHCIAGTTELESALVDFDYDSKIAETVFTRLSAIVATDHGLDYSVVELKDAIDRPPLVIDATPAQADQELLIIQHPGGEPKQVSVEDCVVGQTPVPGRGDVPSDFEHLCDTQTGSSGAPVIDRQNRKVVGLHHLGFDEENDTLLNRAVHIGLILEDFDDGLRDAISGDCNEDDDT